jgi:membrane fusion protein, multidrug efflux system
MSTTHSTPALHSYAESLRSQRSRRLLVVAVLAGIAGVAYGAYWWSTARFWIETDNAYVTGNLIPVAAQASGIITRVLAEETQFVHRGDVMIHLDEHEAYAALGRARGRLGETVRRINALFITKRQLDEKLAARRARLDIVRHDVDRYRQASPSGAVSKQILQNATDQLQALEADVRETQAEYDALDAQIGGTTVMEHPAVELAKHEFIVAHLEYARQQILAPVPDTSPSERPRWVTASSPAPIS